MALKVKTLIEMLDADPALLDGITLPVGMDASYLKELIKDRSGELYSWIQDAVRLKARVSAWAMARTPQWARAYEAMTESYDPLHNYNREELGGEEIAKHKGTRQSTAYKDTETPGVTVTNTGKVVPYDTSSERETGQSVQTPSGFTTREGLAAENYVDVTDIDATHYDRDVHTYVDRITRGNIGVTKSQDMARDEVELRMEVDLYERIAAEFEAKFLMQFY